MVKDLKQEITKDQTAHLCCC